LLGWRSAFLIAGILGAAGVLIAWAALPRGDSGGEEESQPLLDFRPVLANRDVLALIVGYAAAIWGCVGLRQWIVVFLTFCAGNQSADPAQTWIILGVGATINFLGVPVGLIGNELSIRYGLRTIATLVFVLSAFAGGLFGFTAMLPYIAVLGLSVVAGFIVQDNFPISPRACSPLPARGTAAQRSGSIPASASALGSSERSYSASRSTNSAGRRSSPPGR
jgi:predicted MFS family arabinose efflux permease